MKKLRQLKDWYEKNERRFSTFSLFAGFVFDSLTLQRIDAVRDNLWFAANLAIVGFAIILLNREEEEAANMESWKHFWLMNLLQFGFGALLGGFFILYFRSGTLAGSWPFLVLLFIALVANELYQKKYPKLFSQVSFLYLSILSFLIFLVPIFTNNLGSGTFVLSGFASLIVIWAYTHLLKRFAKKRFKKSEKPLWAAVLIILGTVNVLYFTNLIPPIPLSLKDSGIFHSLERDSRGGYVVGSEEKSFFDYFRLHERIDLPPGEDLYAYSAIYSPSDLDVRIVHEWQYQSESGAWLTATRIPLLLSGGRVDGFRTYSEKSSLAPGLWRVNIETPRGALLGRRTFHVVSASSPPKLIYDVKK